MLIRIGPNVHRGYSWPGLEKVSQYIPEEGENADDEDAELRKVQDFKVTTYSVPSANGQVLNRY